MNVSYRVLSTSPIDNSLVVRYWTDIATENVLAISFDVDGNIMLTPNGWPVATRTDFNVTLYNTNPSANDVSNVIHRATPVPFLQMQENAILDPENIIIDFSNANSLIGVTGTISTNTSNSINNAPVKMATAHQHPDARDAANLVINTINFAFVRRQIVVDTANFVLDYLKANNSFDHWPKSNMWLMTPPKYIDGNTADPPVYIDANGISMTLDSRTFSNSFPGLVHFEGLVHNISVSGNESHPLSFTPDYSTGNVSIEEVIAIAERNSANT